MLTWRSRFVVILRHWPRPSTMGSLSVTHFFIVKTSKTLKSDWRKIGIKGIMWSHITHLINFGFQRGFYWCCLLMKAPIPHLHRKMSKLYGLQWLTTLVINNRRAFRAPSYVNDPSHIACCCCVVTSSLNARQLHFLIIAIVTPQETRPPPPPSTRNTHWK